MSPTMRILPAGDRAFVVELGDAIDPALNARVRALARAVAIELSDRIVEVVPTYRSLLVVHDPLRADRDLLTGRVAEIAERLEHGPHVEEPGRLVHLPACYGGAYGPDLEDVARLAGLTPEEVVATHAGATYLVYMLGFTPGFPYLGGMAQRIATARLDTPRQRVEAGFIGIGGQQTGIYPVESPGGWRLVARTPVPLFDPASDSPFLLRAGDRLRFQPVPSDAYADIESHVRAGTWRTRIDEP